MNIQKASKKAAERGSAITRDAWLDGLWVKPTDTDACCIIGIAGEEPCPRWQPTAKDLIAGDWKLIRVQTTKESDQEAAEQTLASA